MTATTAAAATERPDTGDMLVIHALFRHGFGALPGLVRAVPDGDTVRACRLVDYLTELTTALHHHHTTEDELMWPLLRDRAPADQALVLRMEQQHERIAELILRAGSRAAAFEATASPTIGDALATTLTVLAGVLDEHLTEEENRILPLAEQVMTATEWERLGESGRASIPRNRQFVFLGFMLHGAPDDQRARMLAALPLPARMLWRLVGHRSFVREYRDIFGTDPQ